MKTLCAFIGALAVSYVACAVAHIGEAVAFGPFSWRAVICVGFALVVAFKL